MKCKACNKTLTDIEAVRKDRVTQEYYDLCALCYQVYKESITTLEGVYERDIVEFNPSLT